MTAPALRLQGVSKHYGTVRAVDRVTLEVSPGEVYALLGLNGAGKTTVMRTVLGMVRPSAAGAATRTARGPQPCSATPAPRTARTPWPPPSSTAACPPPTGLAVVREDLEAYFLRLVGAQHRQERPGDR